MLPRSPCHFGGNKRLAAAEHLALHGCFRVIREDKGWLAAVAVRRVVFAMQRHMTSADEGRQRDPAVGLVRSGPLDPGEADFAAVVEAKAASIDHGGDAAFALRLERAIGVRPSAGGQREKCRNNGPVTPCRIGRYAAHSGRVPVCSTSQYYQR